ncbi:MAG: ATP-binding cassette domain-containing protein [Lachnospiraceae bacterium]|nr:ATP-binding cassette domain-containing protein [Lachnospiraceae bacterium]
MSNLVLKGICKTYPNGFEAVKDFNLEIEDKEFIIFVGPSGCGKSTTLRMIAGLEDISAGELYIDGKQMNDVAPKDRDIAMVFLYFDLAGKAVTARMEPSTSLHPGDAVKVTFDPEKIHVFDKDTEKVITN